MDVFWAAPPISRTIAASALTLSSLLYSGIIPAKWIIFWPPWLFKLFPEVWRLVTPFIITGPQLGLLLDPYFLYTYGSALERGSPRFSHPGDFITYLGFVCAVIIGLAGFYLRAVFFTPALIMAFAYTYSQDNPTSQITFYVVTFQVKYLPYAMIAMTLATGGVSPAMHQCTGLLAAHLYDFLTRIWPELGGGRNYIQAPATLKRWLDQGRPVSRERDYGTATAARTPPRQQTQSSQGWTSGSSVWGGRGAGRRLGGD